jgi:hypothetical protein
MSDSSNVAVILEFPGREQFLLAGPAHSVDLGRHWGRYTLRRHLTRCVAGLPAEVLMRLADNIEDATPKWMAKTLRAQAAAATAGDAPLTVTGPADHIDAFHVRTWNESLLLPDGWTAVRISVPALRIASVPEHAAAEAQLTTVPEPLRSRVVEAAGAWSASAPEEIIEKALSLAERLIAVADEGHKIYPNLSAGPFDHCRRMQRALTDEKDTVYWLRDQSFNLSGAAGDAVNSTARIISMITAPENVYPNRLAGGAEHDRWIHDVIAQERGIIKLLRRVHPRADSPSIE